MVVTLGRGGVAWDVLSAGGAEEGDGLNRMFTREIVPPEPHSKGPDMGRTWAYLPRWLRFVLVLIFIAAGALIFIFIK
jgi:hypothetical protein